MNRKCHRTIPYDSEKCLSVANRSIQWMKAKIAKKPEKKTLPLEEDERIVTGTLQGAKECKTGLAKQFDNVDDAIEYLRDL